MKSPLFWIVLLLLCATALVLHSRGDQDDVPYSRPLSAMPQNFGTWYSRDVPLEEDVLSVLGKGDFLNRVYYNQPASGQLISTQAAASANAQPIGLFIGYFPTQRTGQSIHSPQNCLPGAGWTFDSSRYTTLQDKNGKTYQVGEYLISNGTTRQFVIYWYQAHSRSIANEYKAKLYMVADAIRMNRTDGAIVRIITPVTGSDTIESARNRVLQFTSLMAPELPQFIPN